MIRCIGMYDVMNREIMGILRRYWPIISSDEDRKEVLADHPSVTY